MNSFNELNGIQQVMLFCSDKNIKIEEFDGFVVSDWGSINEMIAHGYAKDSKLLQRLLCTS
jgi:beta-glucosidase